MKWQTETGRRGTLLRQGRKLTVIYDSGETEINKTINRKEVFQ